MCVSVREDTQAFDFTVRVDDVKYEQFFSSYWTTFEHFCTAIVFFILICDVDFELSVSAQLSRLRLLTHQHTNRNKRMQKNSDIFSFNCYIYLLHFALKSEKYEKFLCWGSNSNRDGQDFVVVVINFVVETYIVIQFDVCTRKNYFIILVLTLYFF